MQAQPVPSRDGGCAVLLLLTSPHGVCVVNAEEKNTEFKAH